MLVFPKLSCYIINIYSTLYKKQESDTYEPCNRTHPPGSRTGADILETPRFKNPRRPQKYGQDRFCLSRSLLSFFCPPALFCRVSRAALHHRRRQCEKPAFFRIIRLLCHTGRHGSRPDRSERQLDCRQCGRCGWLHLQRLSLGKPGLRLRSVRRYR